METIKESVWDEGNVVTCRKVGIDILNEFLKLEGDSIAQAKFVSGYLPNGCRVATVLSEPMNRKLPIDNIISEHVYSVGKKAHPSGLLPVEFDTKSKNPRIIKCSQITSRKPDEMHSARFGSNLVQKPNSSSNIDKKVVAAEAVVVKTEKPKMEVEKDSREKKTVPPKQNNTMTNFFSHKPNNSTVTNKSKENGKSTDKPMNTKSNENIKKEEPVKTEKQDVKKTESKNTGSGASTPDSKFQNIRTYGKKKPVSNAKAKESNKKGEKRKRIRTIDSDDESDPEKDPFASSDEEIDNIVDSDNDENIIPPTPEVAEKPRIRVVMKTVKKDKVFMGDDDYIHTVRNVCENVTEIETSTYSNDVPAKKSPKKLKEKDKPPETKKSKKASPTNGPKQGNIMNYFSKK